MLTPEEQAELELLSGGGRVVQGQPARAPSDLQISPIGLTPEEEQELAALDTQVAPQGQSGPVMRTVQAVGDAYDTYSGSASARQFVNKFVNGGDFTEAKDAAVAQYGRNPDYAPTGKEIAQNMGLSGENQVIQRNPMGVADESIAFNRPVAQEQKVASPAGIVGVGMDMALDPLALLPFGKIAKGAARAAGTGSKVALKGSAKALDLATGLKTAELGEVTSRAAIESTTKVKQNLRKFFTPEVAPDFGDLKDVALKNGIDEKLLPEAIEFGENSVISRASRVRAEGPLGQDLLNRHEKFVSSVGNAVDTNIKKMGQTQSIPTRVEAGRALREGYDKGVDNFFNQMDVTYNSVMQMAPSIPIDANSLKKIDSKMNGIEKFAIGRIERGITKTQRTQAKELVAAVNAYRNSNGSMKQMVEAMREIGDVAFKSKNTLADVPSDVEKLRDMYFSMQKGVEETVRSKMGTEIADQLLENNKKMTEFFGKKSRLANTIGSKNLADENVFESLIMRGDSQKIDDLMSILPPEEINKAKAAMLDNLVSRSENGINFKTTRNNFKNKKDILQKLFKPEELKDITDVIRLGERGGIPIMSTSGTGASGLFKNLATTAQDAITSDVMIDGLKNKARSRLAPIHVTNEAQSGVQLLKSPRKATYQTGAKGAQQSSIQQRNR